MCKSFKKFARTVPRDTHIKDEKPLVYARYNFPADLATIFVISDTILRRTAKFVTISTVNEEDGQKGDVEIWNKIMKRRGQAP